MRKKYGQNFLVNSRARQKLLDALDIRPNDEVWEIGPGLGAMTTGLLERGAKLTAFEIDPAFGTILGELFGDNDHFRLVKGDVFKTWPAEAAAYKAGSVRDAGGERCLLGNLPYNIAASILADFIEKGLFFRRCVVTVQREVARRMLAKPGSPDYSSFTVLMASAYTVTPLAVLKGSSFYPVPRVDSQGVKLEIRSEHAPWPPLFHGLVRSLFSSRRKTIKNNLSNFAASCIMKEGSTGGTAGAAFDGKDLAVQALESCGLVPERRAETLAIEEFAALARTLEGILGAWGARSADAKIGK
jgi:16S rRNA (adenine1518-N6/adenine1519-N6)-dimethyltransferase